MGYIYTQTSPNKQVLVVNPREVLMRRLNLNDNNWFDQGKTLSIGMLVRTNGLPGNSGSSASNEVLPYTMANRFSFGLKTVTDYSNPSAELLPGEAGSGVFVGISQGGGNPCGINWAYDHMQLSNVYNQFASTSASYSAWGSPHMFDRIAYTGPNSIQYWGVRYYNEGGYLRVQAVTGNILTNSVDQTTAPGILQRYLEKGPDAVTTYTNALTNDSDGVSGGISKPATVFRQSSGFYNFYLRWPCFNNCLNIYSYGWALV